MVKKYLSLILIFSYLILNSVSNLIYYTNEYKEIELAISKDRKIYINHPLYLQIFYYLSSKINTTNHYLKYPL